MYSNRAIKKDNKNLHRFSSSLKRPLTIIKMNDNINIDSTIAGSMNAYS